MTWSLEPSLTYKQSYKRPLLKKDLIFYKMKLGTVALSIPETQLRAFETWKLVTPWCTIVDHNTAIYCK